MKKLTFICIFIASHVFAQQNESVAFGAGFAHFDSTDGFEMNVSYASTINRYLGFEFKVNYARTNDFPKIYKFPEQTSENYWYSKSTIFNLSPLMHLIFINEQKHHFSFYAGVGLMYLDTADNSNAVMNPNEFMFASTLETYRTISKTFGIK